MINCVMQHINAIRCHNIDSIPVSRWDEFWVHFHQTVQQFIVACLVQISSDILYIFVQIVSMVVYMYVYNIL